MQCYGHDSLVSIVMQRQRCDSTWKIGWFVMVYVATWPFMGNTEEVTFWDI